MSLSSVHMENFARQAAQYFREFHHNDPHKSTPFLMTGACSSL